METTESAARSITNVIFYNVKHLLRKSKADFDNDELHASITERVEKELSTNPKAFGFHDIDSEAYIITEMLNKYGNES